ncbi:MAG: peptidylprolyl isomerase [Salinibacterium sp.]|nr:MAG: peptidylprolyl isomerase [Salinibacterium sp.]
MATRKTTEREAREARDRLRRYTARQQVNAEQKRRRKRDNMVAVISVAVVATLATMAQISFFSGGLGAPTPTSAPTAAAGHNVGNVPDPSLAGGKTWTGVLKLNNAALHISLDGAAAPQAVSSFLASAREGYYQSKTCHRMLIGATAGLIQCGSIDGVGGSDPNYSFGPIENPGAGGIYPVGTIAMARPADNAYGNGKQFFIVFAESTLPNDSAGGYTIIGHVTSGLDQLEAQITSKGIGADGVAPKVPTRITKLTID